MCGIVGYCAIKQRYIDKDLLIKMRDTLSHRGPDDAGIFISEDKTVGLAHRRLSILDISEAGHQPMSDSDGTVWITYNGEIYNFQEIRDQLRKIGYSFKSNTDTEVILYSYKEYGLNCLYHFNGMFAFAVYDRINNVIFMARDRFGIKPFYYAFLKDGTFTFASEIKAITAHHAFEKKIDYGAMGDYFKYRYIPSPKTIWKDISKLPHGHFGILDLNNFSLRIKRYYSLADNVKTADKSSIEEVEYYLHDAVKKNLISDVEVGTLLSGGIDSSTVSFIAKQEHPHIKSFSIGFKPDEFSELPYSSAVADCIGITHVTKIIDNIDGRIIEQFPICYDEPLADSSCIPTYLLCEMVSNNISVALSGDGGDEVFSGYNWYESFQKDYDAPPINLSKNIISVIKKFFGFSSRPGSDFEKYYNRLLLNRFDNNKFQKFLNPEIYREINEPGYNLFEKYGNSCFQRIRALQYYDMNTFMVDDILVKVDRASMAHSLEVRVPLLDHRLVEAVFRMCDEDFPSNSTGKPILKKIMQGKLPPEIFSRPKKGFSAPITYWKFYAGIGEFLLDAFSIRDGLFNKEFIDDLIRNEYPNSEGMLWMIYVFEKWYRKWFLE